MHWLKYKSYLSLLKISIALIVCIEFTAKYKIKDVRTFSYLGENAKVEGDFVAREITKTQV